MKHLALSFPIWFIAFTSLPFTILYWKILFNTSIYLQIRCCFVEHTDFWRMFFKCCRLSFCCISLHIIVATIHNLGELLWLFQTVNPPHWKDFKIVKNNFEFSNRVFKQENLLYVYKYVCVNLIFLSIYFSRLLKVIISLEISLKEIAAMEL